MERYQLLLVGSSSATPMDMTQEEMQNRLNDRYPNCPIQVVDLTGTSDHWEVYVESPAFKGLTRIEQHQHVMACFASELKTGEVHALSIKTQIPKT